ncbi:MAG: membrane protease YdiL (CAAX protease family) [Planctomycetota bacterium]|jgi:membrane protease YdiL (CAAX protease family)
MTEPDSESGSESGPESDSVPDSGPGSDAFVASMANLRSWLLLVGAVAGFVLFIAVDHSIGAVVLVALLACQPPSGTSLRWDFWRPGKWWPAIAIYVPFVLLWVGFATGYLRFAESIGHHLEPQGPLLQFAKGEVPASQFWSMVVLIVVLAPICEEIVFRGYLFRALQTTMPMWATQLVTATLFGLVHGPSHALPIGVLSLLFGYLRQRYGSLWPSMLAHAVHNGITLVLVCSWPGLLDLFYNR